MKAWVIAALLATAACGGGTQATGGTGGQPAGGKSLYERLGGQEAIKSVVHDFTLNVAADNRINGRFQNADMARIESLISDQVCEATGGPCKYTGKAMDEAHTGMNISAAEFDAMIEDLQKSLAKFNVPKAEQDELLGKLAPLKAQIVGL